MKYSRNTSLAIRLAAVGLMFMAACEPATSEPGDAGDASGAAGDASGAAGSPSEDSLWTEATAMAGWNPHVSEAGLFTVFGPKKRTTSELKVPTPVGEQQVPVTYFNHGGNIFYVSSHVRDPRLGAEDRLILENQAKGILARFEKYEVRQEAFVFRGRPALRLQLQRPDSYKIIELHVTPLRLYQVVTDLPSATRMVFASRLFRTSFTPLDGGKR